MSAPISATAGQLQQRPAVSILPPGHFARAGGAELSPAERRLIEDFRALSDYGRDCYTRLISRTAARERAERIESNKAGLRLVGGAS